MSERVFDEKFFLKGKSLGKAIVRPFERFTGIQASSGIVLLVAAVVGLVLANSSLAMLYHGLFHTEITLGLAGRTFDRSVHFWINEGLMAVFFFLVGLEIKREMLVGELSSLGKAVLPAVAAVGGMAVPAAVYLLFNRSTDTVSGWAIPMATDIAFVVGALSLLGPRVPPFLSVFLVSLAIFDDLGAVMVIALFYGGDLQAHFLVSAGLVMACLAGVNILGFRRPLPYLILGVALWACIYLSGIHATIAGVLLALAIPARSGWDTQRFADEASKTIERFEPEGDEHYTLHLNEENRAVVQEMEALLERIEPPLQRVERALHPWVAYGIMPLFALANCGVPLQGAAPANMLASPASMGILTGLFIGKQVGIFSVTWVFVKSGLAAMPEGMSFRHVYGGALLCGIGFTMSLFIADLSFVDQVILDKAKIGILLASMMSGLTGMAVLWHRGALATS